MILLDANASHENTVLDDIRPLAWSPTVSDTGDVRQVCDVSINHIIKFTNLTISVLNSAFDLGKSTRPIPDDTSQLVDQNQRQNNRLDKWAANR